MCGGGVCLFCWARVFVLWIGFCNIFIDNLVSQSYVMHSRTPDASDFVYIYICLVSVFMLPFCCI